MELAKRYKKLITEGKLFSPKDKLLLAVSGGVDSVVLCGLCKQAGYDFVVAHCNFKLREEESDSDAAFVKALAEKYGVPFFLNTFDTKAIAAAEKKSIEEAARDLRYAWFHQLLESEKLDWIVTAHHGDDNIETMAMNFFRGTGIKGMRGMQPKNGKIVRPMLSFRKQQLEDYARAEQLAFVIDKTNLEDNYTRNFFRNQLIPLVKKVYPGVEDNLLHNLDRFAEIEELYGQALAVHKKSLLEKKGEEWHIPVLKLKKASPLKTIVYEIISAFGFSAAQTDEVIALLDSESGKYVASATHRVIRNRAWLIISPLAAEQADHIIIDEGIGNLQFPGGNLTIKHHATANCQLPTADWKLPTDKLQACLDKKDIRFPLLLRPWKEGDYFYPLGMKKKKKVARFLIDQKLSKTEKEKVWVIESDKRIIWVLGMRIDDRFKITERTKEVLSVTFQNV